MDVISHPNTNNFNPVAQFFVILNNAINFVYNGSLPLTDSSATIEYFDDNYVRADILYLEISFIRQPEIFTVRLFLRHRKFYVWKRVSCLDGFSVGGGSPTGRKENQNNKKSI